jgi:hypothetical protein
MEMENPLKLWANHVMQFSHVYFLACQVLGIVGSQIETEQIFNVHGIITNLDGQGLELITRIVLSWLSKIGLTMFMLDVMGGRLKIYMITYMLNKS